MEKTIQLDCPPGNPRPGDLLALVLVETGIEVRDPVRTFFGEWTWDFSDVPDDRWKELQPIFELRIKALYNSGHIRYGSW